MASIEIHKEIAEPLHVDDYTGHDVDELTGYGYGSSKPQKDFDADEYISQLKEQAGPEVAYKVEQIKGDIERISAEHPDLDDSLMSGLMNDVFQDMNSGSLVR